jgi:hypothetical protein
MWSSLCDELREIFWLVSIIGSLSILGMGFAAVLSQVQPMSWLAMPIVLQSGSQPANLLPKLVL